MWQKGSRWMPWFEKPMKDGVRLRKVSVRRLTAFDPGISEWGNLTVKTTVDLERKREVGNLGK